MKDAMKVADLAKQVARVGSVRYYVRRAATKFKYEGIQLVSRTDSGKLSLMPGRFKSFVDAQRYLAYYVAA